MMNWVNEAPKGSGKGRKGKSTGNEVDRRNVRPRVQTDLMGRVVNALNAVGTNSLQNSRAIRMLSGLALSTSLTPADPGLERAAAEEPTPDDPHRQHLKTWGALVAGLAVHPKIDEKYKKILTEHAASINTPDELADKVGWCHVQPTFNDANIYRVQFQVSTELHKVGAAVLASLASLGGTAKYSGPPRSRSERAAAESLRLLAQSQ
jgi:hypothetical protein